MFIGQNSEIKDLENFLRQKKGAITVIYGRRRVGKNRLIRHCLGKKNPIFFEGIEGLKTKELLIIFKEQLVKQI